MTPAARISSVLSIALAACSGPTSTTDASTVDALAPDAVAVDAAATDAAATDAAVTDGGDAGLPLGAPIVAPDDTWTWVDFPDAVCDDGSPTGIGVSPSSIGSGVLVFFNGGGACWDYATCVELNTSTHGPFGATQFGALAPNLENASIFDRGDTNNPFRDFHFVFVPYCTGDVHGGSNVATYTGSGAPATVHHVGRLDVEAYARRIAATWPAPARVVVAGASAGGYGAVLNHRLFRAYWPAAEGFLVDDSGPFLEGEAIPAATRAAWNDAWHLDALTSELCGGAACDADLSELYPAVHAALPDDRIALLSYTQDATIRSYLMLSPTGFETALAALVADRFSSAGTATFRVTGSSHVLLAPGSGAMVGGQTPLAWLGAMLARDASWISVGP